MDDNIHILVNCAGIQRRHPAVAFPESDWDDASASTPTACDSS
jgi:2-deoxy-D-gluconate 3-dehydrogenase